MSPHLPVTADELWRHLPGGREESVHLADFPRNLESWTDAALQATWERQDPAERDLADASLGASWPSQPPPRGRLDDAYSSTKTSAGGSASVSTSASGGGGGGIDLGIVSFGGEASTSASGTTSTHFDVASVGEQFSHVAETSSLAVESERSIVVSTFEDQESLQSTARTLRNDNVCRAVTYFIRRVFEVYELRTRIVAIEVQVGNQWVDLGSTPDGLQKVVRKFLAKVEVGAAHDPRVEIALPTDGLLYEAELAHCCSCECEHEAKARLELERLQLDNLNLRLEAERRQKRLVAGDLAPFETLPPASGEA